MKVTNFSRAYRIYTLTDGIRVSLLNGSALITNDKTDKSVLACCHNDGTRKVYNEDSYAFNVVTLANALKMARD